MILNSKLFRTLIGLLIIVLAPLVIYQRTFNSIEGIKKIDPYLFSGKKGWAIGDIQDIQLALKIKADPSIMINSFVINYGGQKSQWFEMSGLKSVFTRNALYNHPKEWRILEIIKNNRFNEAEVKELLGYNVKYLFISKGYNFMVMSPFLKLLNNNYGSVFYKIDFGEIKNSLFQRLTVDDIVALKESGFTNMSNVKVRFVSNINETDFIVSKTNRKTFADWKYERINKGLFFKPNGWLELKLPSTKKIDKVQFALSRGEFEIEFISNGFIHSKIIKNEFKKIVDIDCTVFSHHKSIENIRIKNISSRTLSLWAMIYVYNSCIEKV